MELLDITARTISASAKGAETEGFPPLEMIYNSARTNATRLAGHRL